MFHSVDQLHSIPKIPNSRYSRLTQVADKLKSFGYFRVDLSLVTQGAFPVFV
jgi:hypothetical protein